jgi:hypothetical protein
MEHNTKFFTQAEIVPPDPSFDGCPLLGFQHMVAPVNKTEKPPHSLPKNTAIPRDVHQLLGGENAPPQVAPPLPDLLRKILEGRKIQNKTIDHFLSRNKSLKRYSSSFKLLWETLVLGGIDPPRPLQTKLWTQ